MRLYNAFRIFLYGQMLDNGPWRGPFAVAQSMSDVLLQHREKEKVLSPDADVSSCSSRCYHMVRYAISVVI